MQLEAALAEMRKDRPHPTGTTLTLSSARDPGGEVSLRYLLPARLTSAAISMTSSTRGLLIGRAPRSLFLRGGVVIGEVCGKGAEAAAIFVLARHTLRAVTMRETRPSDILSRSRADLTSPSLEYGSGKASTCCSVLPKHPLAHSKDKCGRNNKQNDDVQD